MSEPGVRIVFASWQERDGQWNGPSDEVVVAPDEVELADGWVHVVRFDSLGESHRLRSYPARVVDSVVWVSA